MSKLTLVIGNPNYSSWSLRAWLALKVIDVPFEEIQLTYLPSETRSARFARYSPTSKVPVLIDEDLSIWETLAIGEYLAEKFPEKQLWPRDPKARATARAVSSEMHAGFSALRDRCTMNCRRKPAAINYDAAVEQDIARIQALWNRCRHDYGKEGPFLFGKFSFADAMFAPVATRFTTYDIVVDLISEQYIAALTALPAMSEWYDKARADTEIIPAYEVA